MRMRRKYNYKRIVAMVCIVFLVMMQFTVVYPTESQAASTSLKVRVQYAGERGDKIRTKCTFSYNELSAMGCGTYYYNNITKVGTVMRSVAYGPTVERVIDAAGIDINSVSSFAIKTSDGIYRSFDLGKYLYQSRYYYPNLWLFQSNEGKSIVRGVKPIQLFAGALNGPEKVPTIIGLKYYCTKSTSGSVTPSKMKCDSGLRFFTGQTDLKYLEYKEEVPDEEEEEPDIPPVEPENPDQDNPESDGSETEEPTEPAENADSSLSAQNFSVQSHTETKYKDTSAADVTSMDTIYYISSIDIILEGSPGINGIKLGADGRNAKVGSTKQITAKIDGDVQGFTNRDLKWFTSDSSIATVDANGRVTIHKKGAVTITATAENGIKASITLNGTEGDKIEVAGKKEDTNRDIARIMAREIVIGDEIKPEESAQDSSSQDAAIDAEALEAAEEFDTRTVAGSAAVAIAACAGGAVFRVRRYHLDVGKTIKKEN